MCELILFRSCSPWAVCCSHFNLFAHGSWNDINLPGLSDLFIVVCSEATGTLLLIDRFITVEFLLHLPLAIRTGS